MKSAHCYIAGKIDKLPKGHKKPKWEKDGLDLVRLLPFTNVKCEKLRKMVQPLGIWFKPRLSVEIRLRAIFTF